MRVYVGNLPFSCTNDKLRDLFAKHGQVDSAQVVTDRETGRSRGFGFVEMADEDARKAIEALNQQDFDGRTLVVNEAKPREERGGRGGRGGRGNF
ncbi:MAG: RNA-binding protein [Myxococcales bacterium]|nr:RNA-binding protein [Myxococcales bacterium]